MSFDSASSACLVHAIYIVVVVVFWGGKEQCFYTVPLLSKMNHRFGPMSSCSQVLCPSKAESNMLVLNTSEQLVYSLYNEIPMLRHVSSRFHRITWFSFLAVTSVRNFSFICVAVFVMSVSSI